MAAWPVKKLERLRQMLSSVYAGAMAVGSLRGWVSGEVGWEAGGCWLAAYSRGLALSLLWRELSLR